MNIRVISFIFAIFLMGIINIKMVFLNNHLSPLGIASTGQDGNNLKYRLSEYEEGPCFYIKSDSSLYYSKTKEFFDQREQSFKRISFSDFKQLIKEVIPNKKRLILILVEDEVMFKVLKKYLNFITEMDLIDRVMIFSYYDLNSLDNKDSNQ
jgi:hypothetical protein